MCRLLGYAAPADTTVDAVLGGAHARVFHAMARLHRDGWGTAWGTPGRGIAEEHADPPALGTTVVPASGWGDPALDHMLTSERARNRIVHLRLATDGMVCGPQNTHPFLADGLAGGEAVEAFQLLP